MPSRYLLYTVGEVRERQLIPALKIMIELQSFGASQAVRALGEIGDASVGPFLLSKFSCEEAEYGAALGMLKYRHAVAYLTNCLDAGKGGSIEILHDLLAIGDPSAVPSIERFVNSLPENASKSRRIAECVLLQLREGNASAVLVSTLDAEKDEHEKIEMIRELGLYYDQRAIDKLFEIAVSSEHTLLRGSAIWTLGAMKDKKALLALISVISTNAPPPADFDKLAILAGRPKDYSRLEAAKALRHTTRQDFDYDAVAWSRWVTENL